MMTKLHMANRTGLQMGGKTLEFTSSHIILTSMGVKFDSSMIMKSHVHNLAQKAARNLTALRRISHLDSKSCKTLYEAQVRSHLESQGHSEDVEEVLCPQRCQSSGSSLASQSSGPAGGADSFMQRLQRSYAHAAHGPPLPPTSNGRIGWRSSLPDLRLERYGACTSVKPMSPGHDQRHALSPRPSSAARPSLQ
nr:uncharacterized protein LOC123751672 [Procambarus clarkii]